PDAWGPGLATDGAPAPTGAACVVAVSGHMHKRAVLFSADHQAADGSLANPPGGPVDPFDGRIHLYATRDFTDPGVQRFSPPLARGTGETLRYACRDDNGAMTTVRQGCEETPGTVPGHPGSPAKPCRVAGADSPDCPASDASYPGRTFTGACVEANLVAGPS